MPYDAMVAVRALPGGQLEILCEQRSYYFQLASRTECEQWATNLVRLAAAAGHSVPGFVTLCEEDEDAKKGSATSVSPTGEASPRSTPAH